MKSIITLLLLVPMLVMAEVRPDRNANLPISAITTVIVRSQLGSGTPGIRGLEPATHVGEGIYHAPQYMSSYPTAAVIWPRVVDVECEVVNSVLICDDYLWAPALGRGEYLFFRPRLKEKPKVEVRQVERIIERVVPGPERIIIKEVPVKPKSE